MRGADRYDRQQADGQQRDQYPDWTFGSHDPDSTGIHTRERQTLLGAQATLNWASRVWSNRLPTPIMSHPLRSRYR